jgi:hypothetical protein
MRSFVGSVARQRPVGNNGVVFSLESILGVCCRGSIFLLITIIHHLLLGRGGVFLSVRSEDPLPREHLSLNNNLSIYIKAKRADFVPLCVCVARRRWAVAMQRGRFLFGQF